MNRKRPRRARRIRISEATKQRWFDRGANALRTALPHLPPDTGYACPLCCRASTDIRAFTAEDVPPRHVGGRPLVLTCKDCNDYAGHHLDYHWANANVIEGFARGELPEPKTIRLSDSTGAAVTAELSATARNLTLAVIGEASDRAAMDAQQASFAMMSVSDRPFDAIFKINFCKHRFSERHLRLSILRAGYLLGFALTGYRFLGVWTPIRQLFRDDADERFPRLVRYDASYPTGRRLFACIEEPPDCQSFAIGFDRWTTFLPVSPTSRLWLPILAEESWSFSGTTLEPWPVEPSFGEPAPQGTST